ncbi:unnamed protein product, partial [Meganyctiphanes norvegica]
MSERCPGMGVSCPFCSKIYHHKSTFVRHYLTHTGEKPVSCPHCPHRATRNEHMRRHIASRHAFHSQNQNIFPFTTDTMLPTNQYQNELTLNNEKYINSELDPN